MSDEKCYCCSEKLFSDCCEPFILRKQFAPTAEALMRSRYSAYATHHADYLVETTAAATRKLHKKSDILNWAKSNQWVKLEIINSSENIIEFKAHYIDNQFKAHIHHERSKFIRADNHWFYSDFE
ncbi:preprotein translocase SecA [Flavobacterium noncentrifugens]|uniref:SEC-C motif-containing protein n=1 Tax=Flavobacterium noncentrifugens TaxID=1128970 RepID=A0A1G8YVK8_9FLAO|nr:YchJ family metal-binding protein [Flavobacterium noncentrifugens]GEP51375.1 preprotein translocase SecA [Flavobacterium noncentrifugens]SDK06796.1 SEC-C motif-containing protein [Flavobacterium noncentrifugens]